MMTLFSAPGYKGTTQRNVNMGACLEITADMRLTIKQVCFKVLRSPKYSILQLRVSEAYRLKRIEFVENEKRARRNMIRYQRKHEEDRDK